MMFITKNPDKYIQEIGLKNEIFISDSDQTKTIIKDNNNSFKNDYEFDRKFKKDQTLVWF